MGRNVFLFSSDMGIRMLEKIAGLGTVRTVWKHFQKDLKHPSGKEFGKTFLDAASIVVAKWGPHWSKRGFQGAAPIGAWILLIIWIGLPILLFWSVW